MNKLQTIEAIKIMGAYCDGKEIESNYGSGWISISDPAWQFGDFKYRIKPEPKVIYVNEYKDGTLNAWRKTEDVVNSATPLRVGVKYMEVIE